MAFSQANNDLAVHLHRLLSKENENVFFSPLSISVAMGMLLCAADGETASELKAALGLEQVGLKKGDVATIFEQQMSLLLQPNDCYTLTCVNCVLIRKSFQLKEEYKKILTDSFKALALEVDFVEENAKAVNEVNEWVKTKSNNMITELLQSLDPSTAFVLLNAVYFKGTWMKKFVKEATFAETFYNEGLEENGKEVEMMHKRDSFPFYEEETFHALVLPYIGEEIAMLLLLPLEMNGLDKLEAMFSPVFFEDLKQKLREQEIDVTLPRFRLEYRKSLTPYFSELGVKRAFSGGAELTVASDSPDLFVSQISHKAVLEMDEEGSVAVAITGIATAESLCPKLPHFFADHPFAFLIYNTKTDLILFMGRVHGL